MKKLFFKPVKSLKKQQAIAGYLFILPNLLASLLYLSSAIMVYWNKAFSIGYLY